MKNLSGPYSFMTRCGNARRYKAERKPTCGCDMCEMKWQVAELRRDLQAEAMRALEARAGSATGMV